MEAANLITPQKVEHDSGPPIFHNLKFDKLVEKMRNKTRWSDLDPALHKDNQILAQTSDLCDSNHAATYLGLLAFAENKGPDNKSRAVTNLDEARAVAQRIRPMLLDRGLPAEAPQEPYLVDEGKQWPLIVMYEHQYLRSIPEGRMTGCCLGWVEKWDARAVELIFHPIAMFR